MGFKPKRKTHNNGKQKKKIIPCTKEVARSFVKKELLEA
jgi:hypothetical protein